MLQRWHSRDGCVLASTLCKCTLGKGDMRRGSISSELLMCVGGVRSILLLPLVARCLETIDVCIWHMFVVVCCSDCVGVCGIVCGVAAIVKDSVLALENVVCLCKGCDGCCVFLKGSSL